MPFLGKFGPKSQIISWSWNLVARLIRICRIQWCCSLFLFLSGNTLFAQIWSKKIKILTLSWNLVPTLIRTCRIQWWCSFFCFWLEIPFLDKFGPKSQYLQFFLFLIRNALFWENLVQNVKVVSLRLNLLVIIFCKIYLEFSRFH